MSFFNVKILQECEKNEKKYFHKLPYLFKKTSKSPNAEKTILNLWPKSKYLKKMTFGIKDIIN